MSIESMTGFGEASDRVGDRRVRVQAQSLNRDGLDIYFSAPDPFFWVEPVARSILEGRLDRGRIKVVFSVERSGQESEGASIGIDGERFEAVHERLEELADRTSAGPVQLTDVLEFRDYFAGDAVHPNLREHEDQIRALLASCIEELVESRRREGEVLVEQMSAHLDSVEARLEQIEEKLPEVEADFEERLLVRLEELVDRFDFGEIDRGRLGEELAYYADKRSVSEELERLRAHSSTARTMLEEKPEAIDEGVSFGKSLDFYFQEMLREINTLSSKVEDVGLTDLALESRSHIEALREKTANLA